jgi:ADP-ribosylglycohydrolase
MNNNNFNDSVICSIYLGFDTDTLAAITGSLAAIIYGFDDIPTDWIKDLKRKDYLDEMINNFSNKFC